MSRMFVNPPGQILHACHIAPFSETGNNGVRNGIVLCANLHAAFDSGFAGIGQVYEVLVNDNLFEERPSAYSIEKLRGGKIWLPEKEQYWPSQELLAKHRKVFFR
ncbi:MAG: HNH endonuclease [Lewinellaceae bacterium]|nr:HNH endonuclease [Phaeodactylibacter sp.]MCB9037334.1 HNH endonuclease [Lewinellaceae bacterium]